MPMRVVRDRYDAVVIGAGPAGMAAAIDLSAKGLKVAVFDEQQNPGGQVYRGIASKPQKPSYLSDASYQSARTLFDAFTSSDVDYFPGSYLWYCDGIDSIAVTVEGQAYQTASDAIVIATGAQERPVAFPGWQLPGVMGVGAAQILLKSSGVIAKNPPVLFGSGPLLYLFAAQLIHMGVKPCEILDTASTVQKFKALRYLPGALLTPAYLRQGLSFMATIYRAGVSVFTGVEGAEALGDTSVEAVRYQFAGKSFEIKTSHLYTHHGVIPETRLAQSLKCEHRWDESGQCWIPITDQWGQSTIKGVFIAGDNAGILGAESAPLSGQLAALAIAAKLGKISTAQRDTDAQPLRDARLRDSRIRPFLETCYRVPESILTPDGDTIVCRCESVTAGAIVKAAEEGCIGPNQLKAFTRCGMGACQGRMCGPSVEHTVARVHGLSRHEVGRFRARAPLRPVSLATLGSLAGVTND